MAGDLEVRPPEWLIRDLLERQVLALVYGDPGTGKSFAALGLAASVATGEPWLGREVATTGPVIYVAGEGHSGIARRLRAWAQHHERTLTDVPLAVTAGPVGLGDPNQAAELEAAVDAAVPDLGASPVLVMIDTVARNFGPGDENSTQDMNRFIAAADAIAHRYGATVLLVHHTGHGDKTRHRGAMALKGALDAEYRLRLEVGGHVELLAQKMKDSPLPDPIGMRLRVVELDGVQSDDGAPVTSVVLEEADPPPSDDPALGRHQRTALDTLRELVADRERTLREGGYGPDGARVTVAQWRDACAAAGMDRRRISDARRTLAVHGHIVIDGVHVYPADEEATE
ncbi:MAG TPA: AAA family ATPase [Gammaproteobacteria bacterium]|nr:AAA family ATPase [Gammaproteobacteria bacterium]